MEDAHLPFFTVGQVADMLDVQQAFLRRLDEHDIVRPARSAGAQRRYSRHDVEQISAVCGLIDEGLSLEGVRRVLELRSEVARLERQVADLRSQLRQRRTPA
jgi:MerR family transcriptional regulator/heat shock protein HspR